MKIDSYAVNMSSTSSSTKITSVQEQAILSIRQFPMQELAEMMNPRGSPGRDPGGADLLTLSPEGQARASEDRGGGKTHAHGTRSHGAPRPGEIRLADKDQMKIMMIEQMLKSITGKSYNFRNFETHRMGENPPASFSSLLSGGVPTYKPMFRPIQLMPIGRIELSAERVETYYESQSMSFQASGVVNTSDGRQINFDLNVLANYEFSSSSSVASNLRLMDPLVINFDGTLPEFTKDRYAFDITIDGNLENIFMPTNGSGFIALDKNGNGEIDDGSELFGARTGDGFAELAAYDVDGNGWIDEGDDVFDKLRIMFADKETGEFILLTLKEAGVGAIYLGSTAADYEIKAADNETAGVVRRNGIFLSENGNAGSVHHIDLTY